VTPEELRTMPFGGFGQGIAESAFSPIALVLVLIAGVLICILPRNKAIIPFFSAAILIPMNQILVVGGLHFPMLRILALFAMARVFYGKVIGKEKICSGGINGIDVSMMLLALFTAVDGVLLWRAWGEFVSQVGQLYTPVGVYFLLRFLIRDGDDVKRTLRVWAWVAAGVAAVMICEQLTGTNPVYAALGGAANDLVTVTVRGNGRRAAGTFAHALLAGTFGAISLPLFAGLWWTERRDRIYAAMGIVAALVIALASGSSTSLLGLAAGILGLCFWVFRRQMRIIRWGIVGLLVSLHLYMNGPVWALIMRMNVTGDSSADHRFFIIDNCIRHFSDWALVGTKNYGTWGWDMWDLSNQYVGTADMSGLIPLLCLLGLFVFGFKYLGKARRGAEGDPRNEWFIWAVGSSLFANLIAMLGVCYWDQICVAWYAILAVISAVTLGARPAPAIEPPVIVARSPVQYGVAVPGVQRTLNRSTSARGRSEPAASR